jgi:predicted nucleotidyltransferase
MKTETKIIQALIEQRKSMTIRALSRLIKSDYRITHTAIKNLIRKQAVLAKTVGKSSLCSLNGDYYGLEIYLAEKQRTESLLKNKNINQLYKEVMAKVKTGLFVFLVFGSYAKGLQTRKSDIDLLFISDEKGFQKKIDSILSLLPLETHALVFTQAEFLQMRDSRSMNVVKEAMENNIILYNADTYYFLKNL